LLKVKTKKVLLRENVKICRTIEYKESSMRESHKILYERKRSIDRKEAAIRIDDFDDKTMWKVITLLRHIFTRMTASHSTGNYLELEFS